MIGLRRFRACIELIRWITETTMNRIFAFKRKTLAVRFKVFTNYIVPVSIVHGGNGMHFSLY